ncbi:hypothetical protein pdam_00008476, partial [Pocillopora damicornis]
TIPTRYGPYHYKASLCYLLEVRGSQTVKSLPILILRNWRNMLCVMFSLRACTDFCHSVGPEIQKDCNFEAHLYYFSYPSEQNKWTEHGVIRKGGVQCTVSAVSISSLFCTKLNSGNFDIFEFKPIIEFYHSYHCHWP